MEIGKTSSGPDSILHHSPEAFDGRGNYTLGLREQLVFPEIDYDKIDKVRGMEVSIVTTARTDEEGRRLLKLMGMPFKK